MNLTIVSARYANPENTAAELLTVEHAAVMASERDRPEHWAVFKDWEKKNQVTPYIAPAFQSQSTLDDVIAVIQGDPSLSTKLAVQLAIKETK